MKIHYLQHVPFEDLANIEKWAENRGHDISRTLLFSGDSLPKPEEFDWLIIMGGPMNIYEHSKYPWLIQEKKFIGDAIKSDKIVLGICLGAQLIADVLGGKVSRNEFREIGWHNVRLTSVGRNSRIFGILPEEFPAFHWHGDTFDVPARAIHTAFSAACKNQAFEAGLAIGLQFHLESSRDSIDHLISNCSDELTSGAYVQSQNELLSHLDKLTEINRLMEKFLDNIEKTYFSIGSGNHNKIY